MHITTFARQPVQQCASAVDVPNSRSWPQSAPPISALLKSPSAATGSAPRARKRPSVSTVPSSDVWSLFPLCRCPSFKFFYSPFGIATYAVFYLDYLHSFRCVSSRPSRCATLGTGKLPSCITPVWESPATTILSRGVLWRMNGSQPNFCIFEVNRRFFSYSYNVSAVPTTHACAIWHH